MNKEQQELLDEAYKNYCDEYWNLSSLQDKIEYGSSFYNHDTDNYTFEELTQEEFINKCKTDTKFSEKWGLQIEERELNDDELNIANLFKQTSNKLITITYNNKTIESYE
jgi:hypothetical protein